MSKSFCPALPAPGTRQKSNPAYCIIDLSDVSEASQAPHVTADVRQNTPCHTHVVCANSQPSRNQKRYEGVYEGTRPGERHRKAQDRPQRTAKPIVKFTCTVAAGVFYRRQAEHPLPLACPAFSRTTGAPTPAPPGIRTLRKLCRQAETTTTSRLSGVQPDDWRTNSSPPGIRSDIAQPGGFCKREAGGVDLRPRPSRRAQQGPLRQSEIASCTQKKTFIWCESNEGRKKNSRHRATRFCTVMCGYLAFCKE